MGTFEYGTLRGDKTVTRVSARLDEISKEMVQLVKARGLRSGPEDTLRHALKNLCAVMPEIGRLASISERTNLKAPISCPTFCA